MARQGASKVVLDSSMRSAVPLDAKTPGAGRASSVSWLGSVLQPMAQVGRHERVVDGRANRLAGPPACPRPPRYPAGPRQARAGGRPPGVRRRGRARIRAGRPRDRRSRPDWARRRRTSRGARYRSRAPSSIGSVRESGSSGLGLPWVASWLGWHVHITPRAHVVNGAPRRQRTEPPMMPPCMVSSSSSSSRCSSSGSGSSNS